VELPLLTIASQTDKMFLKEEYPLKGYLNMEVDSQKRSDLYFSSVFIKVAKAF
jgi:hypothetical protein